jgi:predicted phage terminase large subunit-like protein
MAVTSASKLTAKAFLGDVAKFAAELRAMIDAEVEGFEADPAAMARRRARVTAAGGFRFFCETYFPHYVKGEPSLMHEHAFTRVEEIIRSGRSVREWLMAPRGEAKTTIVTQLGTLWAVVTGLKRFAVIIMASLDLSVMILEAVKAELECNPRLAMDFPEACGVGRVWQSAVAVTRNDAKIMAAGAGKKLRGMRHGPHRPDLVLLDDMENDENVKSPEQRDKRSEWIDKAVIPLGPPGGGMALIYVGTLLHYDAVLARKSRNPMWTGRKFQSIVAWPDRMDLWDRWEEILRNEGEAPADRFYAERKGEMDAGAKVSWPSVRPLEFLMKLRVTIGAAAFDSEQQNDPIDEASAVFGRITFWVERLSSWMFFGAVDPSLGKQSRRNDPSAILVGGFDRESGVLDVVEAQVKRRLPDLIIEDVIALEEEYRCRAWGVEVVAFQEFFASEMVRRSAARRIPVPVVPIQTIGDKELRIERLQPHVANGLIRLHPRLTALIEQLRHWPMADHDDGPDALEMLWQMALGRIGGRVEVRRTERARAMTRLDDYRMRTMH